MRFYDLFLRANILPSIYIHNNNNYFTSKPLLSGRWKEGPPRVFSILPHLVHPYLIQPRLSHCPLPDSMPSSAFLYLTHHPSHTTMLLFISFPLCFHNTCPSHLNQFLLTTSVTSSISILSLSFTHGSLYPSEIHL